MRALPTRRSAAWAALTIPAVLAAFALPLAGQTDRIITGSVRNAETGAPVPGATLRTLPSHGTCATGGDGRCRLAVGAGVVEVRVEADGFAPASRSVAEGTAVIEFELQPSAVRLPQIVAVGARSPERSASQAPVPTDVVSSQQLEGTGLTETWEQLQRLVPSLNSPHIPIGDNHMRPVTLRGLAPHHVLVLVNGKRRHAAPVLLAGPQVPATAFTDLNAIPTSAIERIEVLRDGAAAQYGSDAIAGVVNVVLKSGFRREAWAAAGSVLSSEDGRSFRDGRSLAAGGSYGVVLPGGAHATLSAEVRDRGGTNRAYPDARPQYFAGDPRNEKAPRVSSYLGNGAARTLAAWLTASVPLGSDVEAYLSGGLADRDGASPDAFFRRPLDDRTVRAIHPDGFLPEIGTASTDGSALAGARGALRGWNWDVSAGWGGNRVAYDVRNSNNPSLGAASPTSFDAGRVTFQQWLANLDVARDLEVGTLPVSVSGGAELRLDRYRIAAGDTDSWRDGGSSILDGPNLGQGAAAGSQGLIAFRPVDEVDAQRSSSAAYLEMEGRPLLRLRLQSAVRAERYSDFGSTTDGKVAARVELTRGVAVRGSLGTGFRAPALAQQHFSSTRTVYRQVDGVNTILTVRNFPVGSPEALLMGAVPLRPEESANRSAGVVVDVPRWPLVTADFYQVNITDRIGLVTDTLLVPLFEANGMRGIGGGSYYTNLTDTRTRGVDAAASHAWPLGRGRVLRLRAGYNRNRTVVTRVAPAPEQLSEVTWFTRTARGVLENGQPREAIALTVQYGTDHWGWSVHNTRSGPTAQLDQASPDRDQVVRASWITDARVSYRLRPRLQVAVSAANLFDVYPDEWFDFKEGLAGRGPSVQGIFRHPGGLSPFGMNGRTVYVHLAWR